MTHEDWDDNGEDWADQDHDPSEYESTICPECGHTIYSLLDKCPACGYWLSDADRRAAWRDASPARWIKLTAIMVLLVLLLPLILTALAMFGEN